MRSKLALAAAVVLATTSWAAAAAAGVVVGATSVTSDNGLAIGYGAPTALGNIIDQSGLSANYVSGVTDFDTFTATATASYGCDGGCFPELGGIAPSDDGSLGSVTFDFGSIMTITRLAIWNQAGSASLATFSIDGVGGTFAMPDDSQDSPQRAIVFSFAPVVASSLTLNFLTNYGYSGGTIVNEVAFEANGVGGVPEPATWSLMISGFALAGAGLRRRRVVRA